MSTDTPRHERVTLTAAQKRVLHSCPDCGHLFNSHDGSGCFAYDDEPHGCTCDTTTATIETTYAAVAALIATVREETAGKVDALPLMMSDEEGVLYDAYRFGDDGIAYRDAAEKVAERLREDAAQTVRGDR